MITVSSDDEYDDDVFDCVHFKYPKNQTNQKQKSYFLTNIQRVGKKFRLKWVVTFLLRQKQS